MKRNTRWLSASFVCLALGLVPAVAQTQAGKAKTDKPPAKAADAPQSDQQRKLDDIVKRREEAMTAFKKRLQEVTDRSEAQKLYENENPDKGFLKEFQDLAKDAKGTEVAAKALVEVVKIAGNVDEIDAGKAAAQTIVAEHAASPEIPFVLFVLDSLLDEDEAKAARETIRTQNKSKPVQATFVYLDAQAIEQDKGDDAEELRPLYDRLAKEFKDVKMPYGDETYGALADGWIFVRDNLQIGKVAPDFETVDENGVKWKLSDYRGKVVVIDFWGEW
jgi:hypothetical protein